MDLKQDESDAKAKLEDENSTVDRRLTSRREKRARRHQRRRRRQEEKQRKKKMENKRNDDLFVDPIVGVILDELAPDVHSVDQVADIVDDSPAVSRVVLSRSRRAKKTLVEKPNGEFVKRRKNKEEEDNYYDNIDNHNEEDHVNNEPMTSSLGCQALFRRLATFTQGLLAGLALLQVLFIWHVRSTLSSSADVVRLWSSLTQPLSHLFYPLLVLALMAALDALDPIAVFNVLADDKVVGKTKRSGTNVSLAVWGLVLNLAALVVSLINTPLDGKIAMVRFNDSFLHQQEVVDEDVALWSGLNVARSSALILTWVIVAFGPKIDALHENLMTISNARISAHTIQNNIAEA